MADREIGVVFQSRYEGNIAKHLEEEKRRFNDFQKWLTENPLAVSVKLDMNGIKAQAAQISSIVAGEVGKTGGASILGPDGRSAAASVKELSKVKGLLQEVSRTTFNADGSVNEYLSQVEQLGNGLQRISNFKKDAAGDFQLTSTAEKDVRTVKQLEDGLRAVNKEMGGQMANAKGRGDKEAQLDVLKRQKAEVDRLLTEAAKGGLVGSAAYTKGENQQDRLAARIAGAQGSFYSAAQKQADAERKQQVERAIKAEEARATAALKANKIEADQAERLLPDRVKYEQEINRIYQERRRIFEQSKANFQAMDKQLLMENRPDLAQKAFNRGINAQSQINQSDLDLSRTLTDSQRRGSNELEADRAKQLKADVEAGQKRIKEKAAAERAARESEFRRELQDIKNDTDLRIAEINRQEKREVAAVRSAAQKVAAARRASDARQGVYQTAASRYGMISETARRGGFTATADTARGKAMDLGVAAAKDMERFEVATRKSGHALDFHSSSLLRNAGTFLRWQIPMRAVMSVQRAFAEGVAGAIRVDRQFATLQTVFQGTAEEASRLKKETLDLAMAQGRSADEAMDSSIRWSRLGMTRLQVLEATRVSLMAANVAEITAAEAAEKLSGIYATYKLNVGDLSGVLNRLNSISNNYNVTVKDLFEGIARVSGVARQAGLELRDLEGIIGAVTGATGRPGQEIGNALKMIITRLGDPKIGGKLKQAFDIDLTGPNGDLKNMSQIMRELADLYPTLNKAEQQRFLMLTAGSRQASRMAQVMTEYRQAQVLAAKAGMDHAASERENQKILASLQSRIESVKASWTDLATSFGDAGGFKAAGEFMRYLQQILMNVSDAIDEVNDKSKEVVLQNPKFAEMVESLGGGKDKMFRTGSQFSREEIQNTLKELEAAKKKFGSATSFLFDPIGSAPEKRDVGGFFSTLGMSESEVDAAMSYLRKQLDQGGDNAFSDSIKETVKDVSDLKSELQALESGRWSFESLGKEFALGKTDRSALIRDFHSMAYLLTGLENGTDRYNEALSQFNRILATGDNAAMKDYLEGLSKLFGDAGKGRAENLDKAFKSSSEKLAAKLAELNAKRDQITAGNASPAAKNDQLEENEKQIREVETAIQAVTQAVDILTRKQESAFGVEGSRRINNYLDDVMAAAKAYGEAFKEFAPDAQNDPVERIMQRHRRALEMGRDALLEIQRETNAKSATTRRSAGMEMAMRQGDYLNNPSEEARRKLQEQIDAQRQIIDQQDEADVIIQSRIDAEDERLEQLRRELDYEEAILRIKRIQNDAEKQAKDSSQAWRFGQTESDKDANQSAAAIRRARAGLATAAADDVFGAGTPESRADAAGQVLQDEVTARQALESMQQRNYQIDAARRQIAFDLLKAEREQTEQASKRFQLASREDQLRAAVLSRTIRDKGALSSNEFSMLSQNSRQAVTNFLPNEAPGLLNEARANAEKTRRELDAEQQRLRQSIADVGDALKDLARNVTEATRRGGALDATGGALPPKPVQDAAATRDNNPVVNLNLGAINLQIKLAQELAPLLNTYVDQVVAREIKAAVNDLRNKPIPNPQGVVE